MTLQRRAAAVRRRANYGYEPHGFRGAYGTGSCDCAEIRRVNRCRRPSPCRARSEDRFPLAAEAQAYQPGRALSMALFDLADERHELDAGRR